jgi:TonB-linked SusC/RagA family outer membrane protein
MPRTLFEAVLGVGLLMGAWTTATVPAGAQSQASVSGTVVRASDLTPIAGAQIRVDSGAGGVTDINGRFRIPTGPGPQVTLTVHRLGFAALTRTVTVGAPDIRLALSEVPVELNTEVVSGTAGGQARREIGNSVAEINVPQSLELSAAPDIGSVLNARAAGVSITADNGKPGAGPNISIRGISSLSLSTQPLLYIDGVRVLNDADTGPSGPNSQQGAQVVSRLNDLDPNDIESIEIIKGPAAGTIYGTEASNGVIQIITKRGAGGRPQWELSVRQGNEWFMNQEGRIPTNWGVDPIAAALGKPDSIISLNAAKQEDARGTPIWRNGYDQGYSIAVGGGSPALRYRIGGNYDEDKGIEPLNGLRKWRADSRVDWSVGNWLDIGSNITLERNHIDLGMDEGNSVLFSAIYSLPVLGLKYPQYGLTGAKRGFFIAPPEDYYSGAFSTTQDVQRATGSVTLTNHATTWFTQRFVAGIDQTQENNNSLVRYMAPDLAAVFGGFVPATDGSDGQNNRQVTYTTLDYNGTAKFILSSAFSSATSLGAQYYSRYVDTVDIYGTHFPAPGVSDALGAAVVHADEAYGRNTTIGGYAQEQFGWHDRAFLTGAVRVDNNSAFGSNFKTAVYPKISGTWVISEEPFWPVPFVSAFQLRAAYGASGQQPPSLASRSVYQGVQDAQGNATVSPLGPGNPNLKPERSGEFEGGFAATFFKRIGLDFTYFTRHTSDAILLRTLAPSLGFAGNLPSSDGFSGQEYVNIGAIDNSGVEAQITAAVVHGDKFAWDLAGNVGTTTNKISSLGIPGPIPVQGSTLQMDQTGLPIDAFFGQRILSAQLTGIGPTARATNLMCDNGHGGAIACASAPVVYLGQPTPKVSGSGSTTFTLFGRLRLYALVDFRAGYQILNNDTYFRCTVFASCRAAIFPQQYPATYDAEVQFGSNQTLIDKFIENGAYAKLREISANYVLPDRWAGAIRASRISISVAARNLHTWTGYSGIDPETRLGGSLRAAQTQAITPPLAQFITTLNVTY